ncbi:phosphoadenosine phosphosulfate reductase [Lophiotrema nucula]|uniref:phosphoadenylyl-sulfate reductase (thioredoxin) n=1 Tax=Lophiotrema nucula TaxID=690887 RepID=A0A6A5YUD5_9PLEO|nr:phosphoadenosine phosphosulfate reductase [Lophiotrema nucula]
MSSQIYGEPYVEATNNSSNESGYASGASSSSSQESLPEIYFTKAHLKFLNSRLAKLEPQDILQWCVTSLPGLYQSTALGLTGLVTTDILSKMDGPLKPSVDLIFLDTLHHFDETLDLLNRVKKRYGATVHVYKPEGCDTADDFAAKHGQKLWETNDELYDWVAKVEPQNRAYADLQVKAVLTGRRKSQGGKRGDLDILEVDDNGVIKVNPLANWSLAQVQEYINANNVPTNALIERGYKSIGDWHSTQPVAPGEDERAGRWKGRTDKSECGIHNPKSRYAQFLRQQQLQQDAQLSQALQDMVVADA